MGQLVKHSWKHLHHAAHVTGMKGKHSWKHLHHAAHVTSMKTFSHLLSQSKLNPIFLASEWERKGKDFTKRKDCFRTSLVFRGIGRNEALCELLLCLLFALFSISFFSYRAQATLDWQMASIRSATLWPLLVFTAKEGRTSWQLDCVLHPSYC